MSIQRSKNIMSRSFVTSDNRGNQLRGYRQQEGQSHHMQRHLARRSMARAALSVGATPQELRTVLEALGLDVTPTGLKIAIGLLKNANAGGRGGRVPKDES